MFDKCSENLGERADNDADGELRSAQCFYKFKSVENVFVNYFPPFVIVYKSVRGSE